MLLLLNRECVLGDMLVLQIAFLVMAVWRVVMISSSTMDLADGYGTVILDCGFSNPPFDWDSVVAWNVDKLKGKSLKV
jgi:hypothetical protein